MLITSNNPERPVASIIKGQKYKIKSIYGIPYIILVEGIGTDIIQAKVLYNAMAPFAAIESNAQIVPINLIYLDDVNSQ